MSFNEVRLTFPFKFHKPDGISILAVILMLTLPGMRGPVAHVQPEIWITTEYDLCCQTPEGHTVVSIPLLSIQGIAKGLETKGHIANQAPRSFLILSESPSEITMLDRDGSEQWSVMIDNLIGTPSGLALFACCDTSTLWICTESAMVYRYSCEGVQNGSFPVTESGIPVGIAIDMVTRSIWIAGESGILTEYSEYGDYLQQISISGICPNPSGLDYNQNTGLFWIVDGSQNAVTLLSKSGEVVQTINIIGCTEQTSIAIVSPWYPNAVNIAEFAVFNRGDIFEIAWSTVTEINNTGFNLYRESGEERSLEQVNTIMIPSRGNELRGATYSFRDHDVIMGEKYCYLLEDVDVHMKATLHKPVCVEEGSTEDPRGIPDVSSLSQNNPNPFNPMTEIKYYLPKGCRVRLEIFDIQGRKINTLIDREQKEGEKALMWNGKDADGNEVSSGIYFYRLVAGDFVQTRKMVLLR